MDGRHRGWLTKIDLGERGAQVTLLEYLGAIDAIVIRRDALEKTIVELIPGSPWEQTVARLRCLRGIDTLSAVGLCAEIGDFQRFAKAGQLMSYLGLTPAEDTSGEKRRLGSITKTGGGTRDDCWSRPPGTSAAHPRRPDAAPPTRRTARPHHRDLLAGATTPAQRLATTRHSARQAPHNRRGRRRPRTRRLLLGAGERRLTPTTLHVG